MSYLRIFASWCWYPVQESDVYKQDPRGREAIILGYARGITGYKLCYKRPEKVVVSRDVKCDEGAE